MLDQSNHDALETPVPIVVTGRGDLPAARDAENEGGDEPRDDSMSSAVDSTRVAAAVPNSRFHPAIPAAMRKVTFCLGLWLVTVAAFFTYFQGYNEPADVFWDENYHVASAEKYLQGVYFQETHTPLGKLLIALGEWWLEPNIGVDKSFLLTTNKIKTDLPAGFSFYGYRFFPALLAVLNAPLFFLAFFKISRSSLMAVAFTVPYVFDNALVVHFRGAMLDGIQVFFTLLAILCFLFAFFREKFDWKYVGLAVLFGLSTGLAAMTKENGLIIAVLGCVIMLKLKNWKRTAQVTLAFAAGFIVPVFLGWTLHFQLGNRFATEDRFDMSPAAASIVERGEAGQLANFPLMFYESNKYIWYDNEGVPELDEFDEEENGSWWYLWPFGGRSISYRWMTPDGEVYHYLYLQGNPVVWFSVLLAVVLTSAMFLMWFFGEHKFSCPDRALLFGGFFSLYALYMLAMAWIERHRVMYLYHYLLALVFGLFLLALCTLEIRKFGRWRIGKLQRGLLLAIFVVVVIATFLFYAPLTYYEPMLAEDVEARALLQLWKLRPE